MKGLPEKDRQREFEHMYSFVEKSIGSYGRDRAAIDCNSYAQTIQHTINTLDYEANAYWIDTLRCRLHYLQQAMSVNGIAV